MKNKIASALLLLGEVLLALNCVLIFLLLLSPLIELIINIRNPGALSIFGLIGILFIGVVVAFVFADKQPILIGSLFVAIGLIGIILLFPDIGTGFTAELVVSVYFLNWVVTGLLFLGSGLLNRRERSNKFVE